ncbi:hypothetical protein Chls_578 [Chlamydia suis]|uniref:Uncharacterized protein n=1 Tax=Chlamydia suis TaxID=83559 RepID=A0ABX6IR65_9CHLA|nr:hypothetical protein Chls_578 [Chlamydia suis]
MQAPANPKLIQRWYPIGGGVSAWMTPFGPHFFNMRTFIRKASVW